MTHFTEDQERVGKKEKVRGGSRDEMSEKMEMEQGREEEPKGVLDPSAVTSHRHAQLF